MDDTAVIATAGPVPAPAVPAASDRQPAAVFRRLRELIVHGRLAPGTRLIELDLASRLGVSRTPLREALQRLQQEGYVVGTSGNSRAKLVVAPMTESDARELFQIVGALEGVAARGAAKAPAVTRKALVAELTAINEAFARAAASLRPNHDELFELDSRFHFLIVQVGAAGRLRALHDAVKPQAERYERLYVSLLASEITTSAVEHRDIVKAINNGKGGRAQDAVEMNWRNAARRLSLVIAQAGERGAW